VQKFFYAKREQNNGIFACDEVHIDEEIDNNSYLDDRESVITPLEPYAKFHEDEDEDEKSSLQVGLLIPSNHDDKFQKHEQQINHAELNQLDSLSLHIPMVIQEQFIEIPMLQGEQLSVQPEDDLPHSLPMILDSVLVLQEHPQANHFSDIRISHELVELRMMDFWEANLKSFDSSTCLLITGEGPCFKF
jgi:hypothetical protein